MKRNPSLPLPESWREPPQPGFLYCRMYDELGWGRGRWTVQVIMDLRRKEYNTSVKISLDYRKRIPESKAEELEKDGIELTGREIRTIRRLYRSRLFKRFLKHQHRDMILDAGCTMLSIYTTSEKLSLYTELCNFFSGDHLPRSKFQLGALWWTKGLRSIYKRIFSHD